MRKLMLLFVFPFFMSCADEAEKQEMLAKIESLDMDLARLEKQNDSLKQEIDSLRMPAIKSRFDSMEQVEEELEKALDEQPELIPEDAVLGGEMHFTSIEILNDELLLAEYEDGHIYGKAVYVYRLNSFERPHFSLLGYFE